MFELFLPGPTGIILPGNALSSEQIIWMFISRKMIFPLLNIYSQPHFNIVVWTSGYRCHFGSRCCMYEQINQSEPMDTVWIDVLLELEHTCIPDEAIDRLQCHHFRFLSLFCSFSRAQHFYSLIIYVCDSNTREKLCFLLHLLHRPICIVISFEFPNDGIFHLYRNVFFVPLKYQSTTQTYSPNFLLNMLK